MAEDDPASWVEAPTTRRQALDATRSRRAEHRAGRRVQWKSGFSTVRDALSFVVGVVLIVHEVFLSTDNPDAYIVGVGVAFCGLPLVLGADERKAP